MSPDQRAARHCVINIEQTHCNRLPKMNWIAASFVVPGPIRRANRRPKKCAVFDSPPQRAYPLRSLPSAPQLASPRRLNPEGEFPLMNMINL